MIAGKNRNIVTLRRNSTDYPQILQERLGDNAPECIDALGNIEILAREKTALFCSKRCPGEPILQAFETARKWREESRCIISGFHSTVEKECLRILLKGDSSLIICPARSLAGMRIPQDWNKPLVDGRLLLLSPFPSKIRRPTAAIAQQRNEFVAALADEVYVPWLADNSRLRDLIRQMENRGIRYYS